MDSLTRSSRKIILTLFSANSLVSAALIGIATLNAIVGDKLGGGPRWAGVPSAVYLLVGAFSSLFWGYFMQATGRRLGLVLGMALGALGAGLTIYAIDHSQFFAFLVGMALVGTAQAAMSLGRFAAAEVSPPQGRGRAISNIVLGGTVGAILGPLLVGPSGRFALSRGADELAGSYLVALVVFIIAGVILFTWLRPDPRQIGREIAGLYPEAHHNLSSTRSLWDIFRKPAALVAVSAMVIGQMVMVMVMVITSLHMRDHQHGLGDISLVISAHTVGMFAFSVLSGRLADRWGRGKVITFGAVALFLACLAAVLSPDVIPLAIALFLLGLGWNFCYVGGSTLLADQLSPPERSRTQGFNDLLVGLASALGSLGSGFVFAALGYNAMALTGAVFSLIPLSAAVFWMRKIKTAPALS